MSDSHIRVDGDGRAGEGPGELSLFRLLSVPLRHRAMILAIAVAVTGIVLLLGGLVGERTYTATASFLPEARRQSSSLSSLAAQFGVSVPTAEGGNSPAFYADLLESREILHAVVESTYVFRTDTGMVRATLVDIYDPDEATPERRRDAAIRRLKDHVVTEVSQRTSVVSVDVTATPAPLAHQIAARLVAEVSRFNLEKRRSQAIAERQFTERRLAEVRAELRTAENRHQDFLLRNRQYRSSPVLSFEEDRLSREVSLRQELFAALAQAYEQAKIEEVRDTPVISIIEAPEVPVRPDPRRLALKGLGGLLAGLALGIVLAFWREFLARSRREGDPGFEEFTALRSAAIQDLLHPWRPLGRALRRERAPAAARER